MYDQKSRRAVSVGTIAAIGMTILGCQTSGAVMPSAKLPYAADASRELLPVNVGTSDTSGSDDKGPQAIVEARHFDIYKRYRAITEGEESRTSGESTAQSDNGFSANVRDQPAVCSFRGLMARD